LNWTDQIGRRASASLAARYSDFRSATAPYHEAAIIASMSVRF